MALELSRLNQAGWVVVTDGPVSMERFSSDLSALTSSVHEDFEFSCFPAIESFPGHGSPPHQQLIGERLQTLQKCRDTATPPFVVTTIQALMQKTISPEWIQRQSKHLRLGEEHDTVQLLPWLEASGYEFVTEVLSAGQAAWRGGILDVWPPSKEWPVRLEFFGSTVDSLRHFDPVGQRSRESLQHVDLPPAAEHDAGSHSNYYLTEHLPKGITWLWVDLENIVHHGEMYENASREANAANFVCEFDDVRRRTDGADHSPHIELSIAPPPEKSPWTFDFQPVTGVPSSQGVSMPLDHIEEQRKTFLRDLNRHTHDGFALRFYFSTQGALDRFRESYAKDEFIAGTTTYHIGMLSESCRCSGLKTIWISEADIYGLRHDQTVRMDHRKSRKPARQISGDRIHSWTDIQPGDYVVHLDHGIGKYRGLYEIDVQGRMQEVLTIEYAEGAKVYIPVAQTHLLSRYIGVGKRHPELHAIGGKRWFKEKAAAERAVQDLAAQLLETQAARDAKPGHAFSPDTNWQHEFEASFPFQETPDQSQAITEVKADMESSRPMDRLICGDVGYGKTEVAMRAAFKAVMDGKQVAILVPTTILAQQHFDSFAERMGAFPVRLAALSRFQSTSEQRDILERLADGGIDIIIGTHRLVQKDVRFRDLGLVIIDEEQRFGVKHKEFLKHLRQLVDVLTMTATPIPRTLYMSLTGAKDLSIIETAPVERLPIETIVSENRDDVVREAILRELNREGQIYYLYNRVNSIEAVRDRLARLVPEARIEVAHGQMNEHQLSAIMRSFTRGGFDVLLCTTIIESGLNIPNVNTIIIDRADRFGLSELYQLRGRVGRYKRKAYAYLLLPKHGHLFFMARQRIGAVKRYSSLGSGFKLAMRDLELRGAGNILGSEQSGHIATVGFDLYCQLLHRTVAKMKGERIHDIVDVDLDIDFVVLSPDRTDAAHAASIPVDYMEDETLRVRMYRRIAAVTRSAQIKDLMAEIIDRFGKLPEPAERLFILAEIKLAASSRKIKRLEVAGEKVIMTRGADFIMADGKFPRLPTGDTTSRLQKLLKLIQKVGD